ncbi:MAG TPA: Fic family protein [Candidatus Paceibacterota bacterium]|nr:Fic family protein [Candidatus Paceibacterota bacterium]
MSHIEERVWRDGGVGRSRRDRQPCKYQVYIPDNLLGRQFLLDGPVAADVADAEAAIARFNTDASALVNTEALARILLRAESVASSRIEGLVMGARRILKAEVDQGTEGLHVEISAKEVLANINAMNYAIASIEKGDLITLDQILEINRELLASTTLSSVGGKLREQQNWIGGNNFNPCSADFVPPHWEVVSPLMADLVEFCNSDDLPAVAQAAIAHAQFATIHPFLDGNGRTGRVLIQMILRRRGLAERVIPPVSLVLATWARDYVEGLMGTRYVGESDSASAHAGFNLWVGRFAAACQRAVSDSLEFETKVGTIEQRWRSKLGTVRKGSSLDTLLKGLVGMPILTVATAMNLTRTTHKQTNEAISVLVEAEILKSMSSRMRNRVYEAPEIIAAFAELERQLAGPNGVDTRRLSIRQRGV